MDQQRHNRGHTSCHLEICILAFWGPLRHALLNGPAEILLWHYSISRFKRKSRYIFGFIYRFRKSHFKFVNILITKYRLNIALTLPVSNATTEMS